MGQASHTLPSSPIHHPSSDFEFTISLSPPTSSATILRPADELFHNGQLLPLHLSPRNAMVHTLLTTTARHSSDSSRPTKYDNNPPHNQKKLLIKQFSFARLSSVFRNENNPDSPATKADSTTLTLKQRMRKYMKKLSHFHGQKTIPPTMKTDDITSYSFSGNLRFLTKTGSMSSCPSTTHSSPNHSGVLYRNSMVNCYTNRSSTSTDELQSAIQGAIAHCKNSMTR